MEKQLKERNKYLTAAILFAIAAGLFLDVQQEVVRMADAQQQNSTVLKKLIIVTVLMFGFWFLVGAVLQEDL